MTFIIQSCIYNKGRDNEAVVPAYDFGYTVIEAVDYTNWYNGVFTHDFILSESIDEKIARKVYSYGAMNYVPIGSVEFCMNFYNLCGAYPIKPLNIPVSLWRFVKRTITIGTPMDLDCHKKWFIKDIDEIKSDLNGEFPYVSDRSDTTLDAHTRYFMTEFVDDIISEWRIFVYNGKMIGLKCYSGDEWVVPDKSYCQRVVDHYGNKKRAYTLDVIVRENCGTDILELHDFFAVGLYGFNHPSLLSMMVSTHNELLAERCPDV